MDVTPPQSGTTIKYRPDIDGLRALAVLSVILYHAGTDLFSGGFVGVDVFFVISGYLITSLIHSELGSNRFRIERFWLRRARRILPALLAVMAISAFCFAVVFPPRYYKDFGDSLIAQSLFVSNVHFWLESGYFDTAAIFKPLLHTWSLSVEEQFYLFFPLCLWLLYSYARRAIFPVILVCSLLSLALSFWGTSAYPDAAFYLLPTRAWELGIGVLLAILPRSCYARARAANEAACIAGLAAILFAVFRFDRHTPYPSLNAVFPVLGTAALVYANTNSMTILGSVLSNRVLVSVGLASYSLYLWHWPILVLNNWIQQGSATPGSKLASVLAATVFALLSYRFIELPVRRNRRLFTPIVLVTGLATLACGLILYGTMLHNTDGWPSRNSMARQAYALERKFGDSPAKSDACHNRFNLHPTDFTCRSDNYNEITGTPYFVWGDSHADAMMPGFELAAAMAGRRFEYATYDGCPPATNIYRFDRPPSHKCRAFNEAVFNYVVQGRFSPVFLAFRQDYFIVGRFPAEGSPDPLLASGSTGGHIVRKEANFAYLSENLLKMARRLEANGITVYVLRQPPDFPFNPIDAVIMSLPTGKIPRNGESRAEAEKRTRSMVDFARANDLRLIDFYDLFCDREYCSPYSGEQILYRDYDHLSVAGAERIAPWLARLVN